MVKKKKKKNKKQNRDRQALKLELAEELDLLDKVKEGGWSSLSSAESGRIGGLLAQRLQDKSAT